MEEKLFSVYKLTDPLTFLVRYVGISCDIKNRYNAHLKYDPCNASKHGWIQELKSYGLSPVLEEIEKDLPIRVAKERELYWIQHYLGLGIPLLNISGVTKPWVGGIRRKSLEPAPLKIEDKLLVVEEVAALIRRTPWTVRRLLREGKMRAYKPESGSWLVKESTVRAYLEAQ